MFNVSNERLTVDLGADAKLTDKEGVSALGWACLRGHRLAVTTLLDKGASVNGVDKNGRTPLDLAATCSDPKIVQVNQYHFIHLNFMFKKKI